MSQFKARFSSQSPASSIREDDVKLRMSSDSYAHENRESPYHRRQADTQNIKKLSFWGNLDSESKGEDEWTERQSPAPFILAIVILVVASTLLWFLFQWAAGENSNTPPIIPADTAPFKVRPENPGGMMIPHQDKLIYGRLSQDAPQPIERLLPPPEQPMAAPPPMAAPTPVGPLMNAPQQNPPSMPAPLMAAPPMNAPQQHPYPQHQAYPPQQPGYTPPQQGYAPQPQDQPAHPTTNPGMQQQGQPQHYTVPPQALYPQPQPLPGQTPYPTATIPPSPYGPTAPTAPGDTPPKIPLKDTSNPLVPQRLTTVEEIKPAEEIKPTQDTEKESEVSIAQDERNELDQLIAKNVGASEKRDAQKRDEKNAKSVPMGSQKHKVQIASLPSRTMAEQEMKRLRKTHASLFQNKPWKVQRLNLGADKGSTHRLLVGSFPTQDAAAKFCKKLRAEKIGCRVMSPANE
ncbi:MAG: hypothetical protein FJX03_06360 [Alphaproteobacteria bacterium]|nr:hypothetical protein [Alphaproteobacteria bacterium]